MRSTVIAIAAVILLGVSATSRAEPPFTCLPGKQPVCLDIGAVVCESNAMCVAQEAICFNADACDSKGLICKSRFDAVAAEVGEKVRKYNQLVNELNDLKADLASLQRTKRKINDCLTFAKTLSDAQSCSS